MTLSEIETILEELSVRHTNLDAQLLSTILLASGWEQRTIQDALVLFKQRGGKKVLPSIAVNQSQTTAPVITQPEEGAKQSVPLTSTPSSIVFPILEHVPVVVPVTAPVPALTPVATPDLEIQHEDIKPKEVASSAPPLVASTETMSFLLSDGTEEGELHTHEEPLPVQPQEKKELPQIKTGVELVEAVIEKSTQEEMSVDVSLPQAPPQKEVTTPKEIQSDMSKKVPQQDIVFPIVMEKASLPAVEKPSISLNALPQLTAHPLEESLIVQKESIKVSSKPNHIPADLPLIPFESSPHIWSFAKYKEAFHADVPPEEKTSFFKAPIAENSVPLPKNTEKITIKQDFTPHEEVLEELVVEKTPMDKEDESLVFLAGVMLLAIILILGYMYSNGRL
jgi:hypothetical protein